MLTANQNQIISDLVAEFTRINEVNVSNGNPLADLLAEANEDKRKYEEALAISNAIKARMEDEVLSKLSQLAENFEEIGGVCTKFPPREYEKSRINLLCYQDGLEGLPERTLNIYGYVTYDIINIGLYRVETKHEILYGIRDNHLRWRSIDALLDSGDFKHQFKRFMKFLNQ